MKRRSLLSAISAAGLTIALGAATSGCTGGVPSAEPADGDGTSVTYLIGQPDSPEQLEAIKADLANFTQASGVTVELQVIPNNSARTLIQTRLRSGTGPDVFAYDTGPGFAGVLADAGLLYDLTDHAEQSGWQIYDWARTSVTFDGKYYGIPDQIEQVGLFYNADLLTQLGAAPPTSLAGLDTAAAAALAAGKIPFAAGNKEGWEGGHMLSMALSSRIGSERMRTLIDSGTGWEDPDVVQAIATWDGYRQAGYLPPSPNAIAYDNSNALFYSGDAAMNATGTWLIQDLEANADFSVGFLPFPAPDGPGIPPTDLGAGVFMSASSQNVTAAKKLMDYLVSPEHGAWTVSQYRIPAYPVPAGEQLVSPLFQQVLDDTAAFAEGSRDGVGYNIDVNATDAFNKVMWDGMQGVLGGTKTPEQLAGELAQAAAAGASAQTSTAAADS